MRRLGKQFLIAWVVLVLVGSVVGCGDGTSSSWNSSAGPGETSPDFSGSPFNGLWTSEGDRFGTRYYLLTSIGEQNRGIVAEKTSRMEKMRVKRMQYAGKEDSAVAFKFTHGGITTTLTFRLSGDSLRLETESGFGGKVAPRDLHRVPGNEVGRLAKTIEDGLQNGN